MASLALADAVTLPPPPAHRVATVATALAAADAPAVVVAAALPPAAEPQKAVAEAPIVRPALLRATRIATLAVGNHAR